MPDDEPDHWRAALAILALFVLYLILCAVGGSDAV